MPPLLLNGGIVKTKFDHARDYIDRGYYLVPAHNVKADGNCSCGKPACKNPGKHPRENGWNKHRYSFTEFSKLLAKWPDMNFLIATGSNSGFFVLDVDPRNGGNESLRGLIEEYGDLPETTTISTGEGKHYYFQCEKRTFSSTKIGSGLDIRAEGGAVVVPPSVHANGNTYKVDKDDVSIAASPGWLINLIEDATEKASGGEDNEAKTIIGLVVKTPGVDFFHDQYEEACAQFPKRKEAVPTIASIRSKDFQTFVKYIAHTKARIAPSRNALDRVLGVFEAIALFERDQHSLEVRAAERDGIIFYDLGAAVVKVTPDGWMIEESPPFLFRRYSGNKPQPLPLRGGSIESLLSFANIKSEQEKLLLLNVIVSAFIPNIPHLVLAIHGPQGSAKTSLLRLLIQLIDPHATMDVPRHNSMEFMQAAAHRYVLPLDNLQGLPTDFSDMLCKLATGAGWQKRQLYTDEGDVIRSLRRIPIINGISNPAWKPDLLDRCAILELDRIPDDKRKDEATINREFETLRPFLLGSIFDILSKAMQIYPTVKLEKKPRMADFALWACAITEAMGRDKKEFLDAYEANIKKQTDEALDASVLASVVRHFLKQKPVLEGSATIILRNLKDIVSDAGVEVNQLPRSGHSLGRKLKEITPSLEACGYSITFERGNTRRWRIERPRPKATENKTNDKVDPPVAPVAPVASVASVASAVLTTTSAPPETTNERTEDRQISVRKRCELIGIKIFDYYPSCFGDVTQYDGDRTQCITCTYDYPCQFAQKAIAGASDMAPIKSAPVKQLH